MEEQKENPSAPLGETIYILQKSIISIGESVKVLLDEMSDMKERMNLLMEQEKERNYRSRIPDVKFLYGHACMNYDIYKSSDLKDIPEMEEPFARFDKLLREYCPDFEPIESFYLSDDLEAWGEATSPVNDTVSDGYTMQKCLDEMEDMFGDYEYHSQRGIKKVPERLERFLKNNQMAHTGLEETEELSFR